MSGGFNRSLRLVGLLLLAALSCLVLHGFPLQATSPELPSSQYSVTIKAPFNQPSYYPVNQSPPPNYRPVADWVGRLILPSVDQYQTFSSHQQETDWAWFQVYSAPPSAQNLVGQTIRLAWSQTPSLQTYVKKASRDLRFVPQAEQAFKSGVINAVRLNGREQVGPLQSLAGGHPYDDVTVLLNGDLQVEADQASAIAGITSLEPNQPVPQPLTPLPLSTTLRVKLEPLMTTGRFYGLVKFLAPVAPPNGQLPTACPGEPPCPSDWMQVQHYNPATQQFDGAQEVIYIPQQPADWVGVYNMTVRDLAKSPAGQAGWYIYGAKNAQGAFTVQAMKPRLLVQRQPTAVIAGYKAGLNYIAYDSWKDIETRKGTIQSVLALADQPLSGTLADHPQDTWKIGDNFLAMHLYGGRGGSHSSHESLVAGTYAGHFSFGAGKVVQDPFTQEPILSYDYLQVYGNGVDGTMAGGNTWANYMGNLQRGVMGTRPVSDTLIKLDTLTEDYQFGDTKLSFFNELLAELTLIGARYRIGDGTGDSAITSATSCVQDSSQAIFLTLARFKRKIQTDPQLITWMTNHPDDPNTKRFKRLVALSRDMAEQLTPFGVVRWDWEQNAEALIGVRSDRQFNSIDDFQIKHLLTGLVSWRTAMPRQGHDEYAAMFLNNGAQLWFLRPNQIGGTDPGIAPLEPTLLLGAWKLPFTQTPFLAYGVIRTFGGATIPTGWDWLKTLVFAIDFGLVAGWLGFSTGFLRWQPWQAPWYRQLATAMRLLVIPALFQEWIFRVLANFYPKDYVPLTLWWSWALLSLGAPCVAQRV
jgi:predicted Abi (CAAX) family protease